MKRMVVLFFSLAFTAFALIAEAQKQQAPGAPQSSSAKPQSGTMALSCLPIGVLAVLGVAALIILISTLLRWRDQGNSLEISQLRFAAVTLTGLGLIFMLSMAMYHWSGEEGDNVRARSIFDACKTIIPPIATLVLGYYFGKGSNERRPPSDPNSPEG
jgi:hypothetical protein